MTSDEKNTARAGIPDACVTACVGEREACASNGRALDVACVRAQQAQVQAVGRRRRRIRRSRSPARSGASGAGLEGGSPTQRQGRASETQAADYLRVRGLTILAYNLRCRTGEIDLVARQGRTLVFVEVRGRQDDRFGGAAASVNREKQRRLLRAAAYFLPQLSWRFFEGKVPVCRFDVVCIQNAEIHWICAAFSQGTGR